MTYLNILIRICVHVQFSRQTWYWHEKYGYFSRKIGGGKNYLKKISSDGHLVQGGGGGLNDPAN